MKRFFSVARLWDAVALAVIIFALWKVFLVPRAFAPAGSRPAPHAVYQWLDGGDFRVVDQRGRVLFLDFFASWCEPCKLELPLVERWATNHPEATVVPIDVGEPRSAALAFARRYHLSNVALDPNQTAEAFFAVQGFPTVIVIDPTGHIRASWQGLNPAIAFAMTNALKTLRMP